jgi:hypothetical protein
MPKIIDYPRASLKSALELAKAVDDLGGECSSEMAAERLNRKVSGAFSALVSATIKFGLVVSKSQRLSTAALYKDYKLAYTPEESSEKLRRVLLSPILFRSIYDRFVGKEIPITHFEKLLIREFEVPDDWASRIASYFIDGAKQSGLLGENNRLIDIALGESSGEEERVNAQSDNSQETNARTSQPSQPQEKDDAVSAHQKVYVVRVTGPGINSTIEVHEPEDMLIVQAMLKKVEKALQSSE